MESIQTSCPDGTHIYYMVWCDDIPNNAPSEIIPDESFELSQYSEFKEYVDLCLKHSICYTASIEVWDDNVGEIMQNIYLHYKENK